MKRFLTLSILAAFLAIPAISIGSGNNRCGSRADDDDSGQLYQLLRY